MDARDRLEERAKKYVRCFQGCPGADADKWYADMGFDCGCNGSGETRQEAKESFAYNYISSASDEELRADIREARRVRAEERAHRKAQKSN